ncbi:UNVERIFIED_CONTAM: hypothetical protein FKN15_013548 [Acipenser sinensis]
MTVLRDLFCLDQLSLPDVCMVLEVLGHQLLKWIIKSNYMGLPIPCVKSILRQVLQGLDYLHTKCKVIHTDIKPENILMCVDDVYIRRMAAEATVWQQSGAPPPSGSSVSTAPREKPSLRQFSAVIGAAMAGHTPSRALEAVLKGSSSLPEGTPQVKGYDFNQGVDHRALLQSYLTTGFQATSFGRRGRGRAVQEINSMIEKRLEPLEQTEEPSAPPDLSQRHHSGCTIFLGYTSNLISSGVRESIRYLAQHNMAFELATGDYLFEPHSGEDYTRDEDHIAHIIELLGEIPPHCALSGRYSREYFNRKGQLRHISCLKPWGLFEVLLEKYEWPLEQAAQLSDFLLPMMHFVPEKRATAAQCLQHPWLNS